MIRILTVIGARPQFIKAASLSRRIVQTPCIDERILHTGQHYDQSMSGIFFDQLGIKAPDYNLGIGSGSHGFQTAGMLRGIEDILLREQFDLLLVYGDTNSTLAGALAASKLHIPVAHVESGLRSYNMRMSEEINRILTDRVSSLHFCPSQTAISNLKAEGISGQYVLNSGDIMLDTLNYCRENLIADTALTAGERPMILTTFHRAENTDNPDRLAAICRQLISTSALARIVLPLHPRTRKALETCNLLAQLDRHLELVEPVGFLDMLALLEACSLVITDSGGLQKEAYFMHRPSVILRDETEWVELLDCGAATLCALNHNDSLQNAVEAILGSGKEFHQGLYGTGRAADIICDSLISYASSH